MIRTALFWAAGALLLAGCSSSPSIPDAPVQSALEIPEGSKARTIELSGVIVKIHRGEVFGEEMRHLACIRHGDLEWKVGGALPFSDRILASDFYDTLQQANYPVAFSTKSMFRSSIKPEPILEVAGMIDKLWVNVCHPDENYKLVKGGATAHVTWQVYDVVTHEVVYETSSVGSYKNDNTGQEDMQDFILGAFNSAVVGLLADQGFHDLVMRPAPKPPVAAVAANDAGNMNELEITPPPPRDLSLDDARTATVTVMTADGMGSGVIISPDGYVLTAYHVVGGATSIKARLASQREVIGDVIRTDEKRDVALIKLVEDHLPALPVREGTEPAVGDEVLAIGTPLDPHLDNTVTRGIVSAYRDRQGQKFIQSDVSVQHGNSGGPLLDHSNHVIGLCDQGEPNAVNRTEGLNFFVPIQEAMEQLKIRYRTPASGHMQ